MTPSDIIYIYIYIYIYIFIYFLFLFFVSYCIYFVKLFVEEIRFELIIVIVSCTILYE